jgi:hypothetical protein
MDSDNDMMSTSHTSVGNVNVRGSSRTIGRKDKCRSFSWPLGIGQWRSLDPHSHSLIWSFSSKPPFLDILQSAFNVDVFAHPRSRPPSQLSFPAHHLRSLKSSHWESSRTTLLQYSDCLEFGKRPVRRNWQVYHPHFPFLTQPNDQHVYLSRLPY